MSRVTITRTDTGETLEIDVVDRADLALSWSVTAHPIERGAAITDHTQALPDELQIAGTVTGIDVTGIGASGAEKYGQIVQWIRAGSRSLWSVVIPGRPGIASSLITGARLGMTMDDRIEIQIMVREVVLVSARTAGALLTVQSSGGSRQRVPAGPPPSSTEGDLSTESQDGSQSTEGGLLWQVREGLRAAGRFVGFGG